jgi:hypothetical protein
MRFPNSIIQYKTRSEVISKILCQDTSGDMLCPFFLELHSVPTKEDTFYLVLTHAIGSSGNGTFGVRAFKIEGDSINWDVKAFEKKTKLLSSISYEYDVSGGGPNPGVYHPVVKIDWPRKTLRIPLIDSKDKITGKHLVYSYNGAHFKYQGVE